VTTDLRNPTAPDLDARARLLKVAATPELALVAVLVVLTVVFTILNPVFLSWETAQTILRSIAFIGIIAVGMSMLLVSGQFDLSVGSVAALGAVCAGELMTAGVPVLVACAAGIAVSGAVGVLNAILTLFARIPVLVVTLGTLFMARGLAFVVTGGQQISPLPESLVQFGEADVLGLPYPVWIFFAIAVTGHVILHFTRFGRAAYASGGNPLAARLAGIQVRRVQALSFVLVSCLAGLSGILIMARIQVGEPSIGQGYELSVLAACVVGGVSLFGGRGSVIGAVLGVIFVQVVSTGLVLAQVDPALQPVGIGAALLVAISLDVVRRQRAA
jgi:ribose/xylose/arabinose/galactoside ABC-type transport system permease subunit